MATIKYFTRTTAGNDKIVPIYLRLTFGRKADFKVKSGLHIKEGYFNNNTGGLKQKSKFTTKPELEKKLRDLSAHLHDELAILTELPDKDWIVKTIDKFHNPEKYQPKVKDLFSFIQNFIDTAPTRITAKTGRPASYKQIREYNATFRHLKDFAEKNNLCLDFKDIDLSFYNDWIEYLQGLKLCQNTIGKKIMTLKIFLNAATDEGLNKYNHYKKKGFKILKEDSENIYLTEAEIQKIYDLDLEGDPLDKVRDLFVIGCWTGLRFSDWNKITPENITNGFLELKQQKTGGAVVIPLHPTVEAILQKYKGQLPPLMTNQKFNLYLKEVARKAKISDIVHKTITKGGKTITKAYKKHELVTTHTGRRSFATNLYKADFPTLSIMQITGHKTEAAFLKYIKITPKEHAEKLRTFWQERTKLKVI